LGINNSIFKIGEMVIAYTGDSYINFSLSSLLIVHALHVRVVIALLGALFLTLIGLYWLITGFQRLRSPVRDAVPERHKQKGVMPTMGGLVIIAVVLINVLICCRYDAKIMLFLLTLLAFGGIGLWDDWAKISRAIGIASRVKFSLQLCAAAVMSGLLLYTGVIAPTLYIPLIGNTYTVCWPIMLLWLVFVLVGSSNAVNLTDGLDGLAIGSCIPIIATLSIVAYCVGNQEIAAQLCIPYVATHELVVAGSALLGAALGFLWYNAYPAQLFMGDVGSLALGAALAYIALVCKQECLFALASGICVLETLSVIVQLASYKIRGKRFFRMAPIHHHFELAGVPESRITARFTIITTVLCLLALAGMMGC
jgi:phospho-N-acetylmuramoyl-pentapeptide-transferase